MAAPNNWHGMQPVGVNAGSGVVRVRIVPLTAGVPYLRQYDAVPDTWSSEVAEQAHLNLASCVWKGVYDPLKKQAAAQNVDRTSSRGVDRRWGCGRKAIGALFDEVFSPHWLDRTEVEVALGPGKTGKCNCVVERGRKALGARCDVTLASCCYSRCDSYSARRQ